MLAQVQSGSSGTTLTTASGWPTAAMLVVVVGAVVALAKMLLSRADQRTQDWKIIAETEKENARRLQALADKALENAEAQLIREKSQAERDQVLLKIVDAFRQSPGKIDT